MNMKNPFVILIIIIIATIIAVTFAMGSYSDEDFWNGVIVEANGIILEFLVIVLLYEAYRKLNKAIEVKPILNRLNFKLYDKTKLLIQSLLEMDIEQEHWIKLVFDAENKKYTADSYSIEYYKKTLNNFDFKLFENHSDNKKKQLTELINSYTEIIDDILLYNIHTIEQIAEIRLAKEESKDYLKLLHNNYAKRAVIDQLLRIMVILANEAKEIQVGHREVW